MKTLMVFDFDHTVVDDNSDTWVIRYTTARMRLHRSLVHVFSWDCLTPGVQTV